jgi:hypothetical protein
VHDVNAKWFNYKNVTRTKQYHDKNYVPKICVEQIEDNEEFYFYMYIIIFSSKKFFKKLPTYMWVMCSHM